MEKLTDLAKDLKKLLQEDLLYEMSNFRKNITKSMIKTYFRTKISQNSF